MHQAVLGMWDINQETTHVDSNFSVVSVPDHISYIDFLGNILKLNRFRWFFKNFLLQN